jgi:hypothetical protein
MARKPPGNEYPEDADAGAELFMWSGSSYNLRQFSELHRHFT